MLIWTEHEPVQKNAVGPVVKTPTAQTPCEATLGGRTEYHPGVMPSHTAFSDPLASDAKAISTLTAKLALAGHELHVVRKDGREYYEVRRWGQCRTCSTLHDLRGFLAQIGGATCSRGSPN